jgi:hypothetical protein
MRRHDAQKVRRCEVGLLVADGGSERIAKKREGLLRIGGVTLGMVVGGKRCHGALSR